MATIGSIAVALVARTAPYERGLKRAERRTSRFSAAIGGVAKRVATFGAAAAAAAAAGLALLVRQQLKLIDATAKMSRNLGLTTEQLIGLQHAAGISGVSAAELETGLRRFEKTISDANVGLSTAVRAFDQLGVSSERLGRMTPIDALRVVADAMARMQNQTDKARIAQDLFGRSGIKLINLLNIGSAGLEQMQAEAERLGLTFSSIDAAKVEAANDAFTRLRAIITGLTQKLTIELAPFIDALITKLVETGTQGTTMAQRIVDGVEAVARAVAFVTDIVSGLKVAITAINAATAFVSAGVLHAIDRAGTALTALLNLIPGVELQWTNSFKAMSIAAEQLAAELGRSVKRQFQEIGADPWSDRVIRAFEDIRANAQAAAEEASRAGDSFNGMADDVDAAVDELKRLERQAERVVQQTRTPLEKYEQAITDLDKLLEKQLITWETYSRAVRMAREELERATKATETIEPKTPAVADAARRTGQFREVQLNRIALQGAFASRGEKESDRLRREQLKTAQEILEKMRTLEQGIPIRFN